MDEQTMRMDRSKTAGRAWLASAWRGRASLRAGVLIAGILGATSLGAGRLHAQAAKPVPTLDYSRYVGSWYAVAQFPQKTKYPCAGPTTVLYALGDKPKTFQSGSFCSLADGGSNDNQASGKLDKSGNGTFKVRTIWPLSTKLLVLGNAPDYSWSVVGSPNHKKLFVLSRTPELAPAALDQAKSLAAAEGYNVGKLTAPPAPSGPPKISAAP